MSFHDAPALDADQAELVFGTTDGPADEADLRRFLADALSDYDRQIGDLIERQAGLETAAGKRACHTLNGSLRTLGLAAAGLRMRHLEDHWEEISADDRGKLMADARAAIAMGVEALRAAYPFLA